MAYPIVMIGLVAHRGRAKAIRLLGSGSHPMTTKRTEIVVCIVNYCTADLTIDCLRSLESEVRRAGQVQVVVADNASPDGSGTAIADAIAAHRWESWARLIPLPRNGGFAFGNNAVLRDFPYDPAVNRLFWLLNPDTVVRTGAATALIDFLADNPAVGIAGSCLEDPDGTQQHSAFRFHSIAGEFEASARVGPITRLLGKWMIAPKCECKTAAYDWLSGASLMIRSEVVRDIGLMDEGYFLYFEETDYLLKAAKVGWACWFVPESRVVHLVGASTGVTDRAKQSKRRSAYWFQSRRRYFIKNHGRGYAIAADVALTLGTLICRMTTALRGRPSDIPDRFLRDLFKYSALWGVPATKDTPL